MQPIASLAKAQRRLILIRHAKAMEEAAGGDHARGLSERGKADAGQLGKWLAAQGLQPDLAICSTATRTRETLAMLGDSIPTILLDRLYLASTVEMLAQIQATDDAVTTLMIVCHNPGAHALLGMLVGRYVSEADADRVLLKFPTSACAVIDFNSAGWRDVVANAGLLVALRY